MLTDKDVKKFEEKINILKKDYDLFLAGIIKLEPLNAREELQKWLRKHTASEIVNSALRFKYNTLVSKFSALNTYWDRMVKRRDMLRDKISGHAPPKLSREPASSAPPRSGPPESPRTVAFDRVDSPDLEAKAKQVYQRYMEAKKAAGDQGGPDFGKFKATLEKRIGDLLGRSPGGMIEFQVKTEEGKVKLKATARSKGKS